MGKSDKSYKWFVRVDCNKDAGVACAGMMLQWIDMKRLLMLHHMGEKKDNPHVHFVLELSSEIQKQSLDTRVKKIFSIEKRSQYSSKIWDGGDEACSYMFHEPDGPVLHNKGFTEDEIDRFKLHNESVQKVLAINKERASSRLPDRAIEHFNGESPSRREVLDWMLRQIHEGQTYETGNGNLFRYVEEVVNKLTSKMDWDWYVESRYKQIFRD